MEAEKINYKTEVLSGLTVALALVPEAIAFALIAGLSPLTGLYAAIVMGLVTSILGGRPGMISGATGAVAVIIVALSLSHGVEYIFATVVLAGIIQVLAGVLKLGKLMRLVPHPVIFGFVNGLAVIIFMAQLDQFKDASGSWLTGSSLYVLLGLVLLTMIIIWGLPKLTKVIPASLVAILTVFGLVLAFGINTRTVGDIASIQGGFPPFHLPNVPFTFQTLSIIFPYAAIMAAVGLALLMFVMFGAGIIELMPMAALTGVMIMVAVGTFEWASLRTFNRMPKSDVFVMVVVTFVTIFLHNLALAVIVGVIISALVFAWDNAKRIRARKHMDENGVKHYEIYGPLFFGSVATFNEKFDVLNDPDEVVIDFKESRVSDMSAIEALNKITSRYLKVGKKVHLKHLSKDCQRLLQNADKIIDVNVLDDPTYKVAVDKI